jgi:hypothetical protein
MHVLAAHFAGIFAFTALCSWGRQPNQPLPILLMLRHQRRLGVHVGIKKLAFNPVTGWGAPPGYARIQMEGFE